MGKLSAIKNIANESLVTPQLEDLSLFLKKVESKWRLKLTRAFEREQFVAKKKESEPLEGWSPRYIVAMFPYPSGRLHLGHVRTYTSSDILARYSRMMSKNAQHNSHIASFSHVINPMGFDSFGLPAENAAKARDLDPAVWTNLNIRTMKKQLDDLAFQFDWREATSNPSFFKWTQAIFLRLLDANLAYKSYAKVNWDPVDKTVLADEQVDGQGCSWRSGALVERRYYKQWFIKTNAFTNAIYKSEGINIDSWRDVLAIQRNWIGKPTGWIFYLPFSNEKSKTPDTLILFTKKPELFFDPKATLLISDDHWLEKVHRISTIGYITNPFLNREMKVIVTDCQSALPPSNFATLRSESSEIQYDQPESGEQNLKREQVLLKAKLNGFGGYFTSDKYRDWLISRQRFWGTPIPVVNCQSCGYVAVDPQTLPVELPKIESFNKNNMKSHSKTSDGEFQIMSPLQEHAPDGWLKVRCNTCGQEAHRECETLDTLFDSSWYFLRYATNPSQDKPFDSDRVLPVWSYIGGIEHAAMHLFYARYMTHFLHSQGLLKFAEPFAKLLVQGIVKSRTYSLNGRYLSTEEADRLVDKSRLTVAYEKMSKSKGNGVDPQGLLDRYGVDATRFCLMSYANPRSERLWRSEKEEFRDVLLHFRRIILTVEQYINIGRSLIGGDEQVKNQPKIKELSQVELEAREQDLIKVSNKNFTDAIFFLQEAHQFRQFISVQHNLVNILRKNLDSSVVYSREFAQTLAGLILMLNPVAPHLSEELWHHFCKSVINPLRNQSGHPYNTSLPASDQPWPLPNHEFTFQERAKFRPEIKALKRANKGMKS